MNREEFFATLAPLDDGRLRKVLWNLYWGPAAMRERIEGELDPVEHARRNMLRQRRRVPVWCWMRSVSSQSWRGRAHTSPGTGGCHRRSVPAGG